MANNSCHACWSHAVLGIQQSSDVPCCNLHCSLCLSACVFLYLVPYWFDHMIGFQAAVICWLGVKRQALFRSPFLDRCTIWGSSAVTEESCIVTKVATVLYPCLGGERMTIIIRLGHLTAGLWQAAPSTILCLPPSPLALHPTTLLIRNWAVVHDYWAKTWKPWVAQSLGLPSWPS